MNNDLINEFIKHINEKGKSLSTSIAYKKDLQQVSEKLNKDFLSSTSTDIKDVLDTLRKENKLTLKTLSRKLNSVKSFYKFLNTKNITTLNPTLEIPHPKYRSKKQRYLTKMEVMALRDACSKSLRLKTMVELLLQTGIRISELALIEKDDLNLKNKTLTIKPHNSNPERTVNLNNRIADELKFYLDVYPNEFKPLFPTKTGRTIEIRNIRTSIDRAINLAQIKNACVNDLRNTFIVNQLNNGMSLDSLANIVGHKNVNTTFKYTILLDKKYITSSINVVCEV